MKKSYLKIIWALVCILVAFLLALNAYKCPEKYFDIRDLLATVIAIFIGLQLAICTVLSSGFNVPKGLDESERKRAKVILKRDYSKLLEGQLLTFWLYYLSLMLSIIVSLYAGKQDFNFIDQSMKILISCYTFMNSLSLLWSATLPSLFVDLSKRCYES